jgi:hypothetical protein
MGEAVHKHSKTQWEVSMLEAHNTLPRGVAVCLSFHVNPEAIPYLHLPERHVGRSGLFQRNGMFNYVGACQHNQSPLWYNGGSANPISMEPL